MHAPTALHHGKNMSTNTASTQVRSATVRCVCDRPSRTSPEGARAPNSCRQPSENYLGTLRTEKLRVTVQRLLQDAGGVIGDELVERSLIHLVENRAELFVVIAVRGEVASVDLAQCADLGIAVLLADLTVFVAVAVQ
jgi:hypothetical protein